MEDLVINHYQTTAWPPEEVRAQIRAGVEQAIANHQGLSGELRQSLEAQLAKGERKESYLIDLAAEEGWPKDVLRDKVRATHEERTRIRQQLDQRTGQLEAGRQVFVRALDLLDDPAQLYAEGNETVWAILNEAFFTRLYVHGRLVTHELRR